MIITWLGHACFLIDAAKKIVTDPFDGKIGYPEPRVAADSVTVSHQHFDHNAVNVLSGNPMVVSTTGVHKIDDLTITGIPSFHDKSGGSKRGLNTIFTIESQGIRVCHLGDLGHDLNKDTLKLIGRVDVLLIPVGGYFTIDAAEARDVAAVINPGYLVPMHYKTSYVDFPIAPVDDFLKYYPSPVKQGKLEVQAGKKPEKMQVVVLELTEVN